MTNTNTTKVVTYSLAHEQDRQITLCRRHSNLEGLGRVQHGQHTGVCYACGAVGRGETSLSAIEVLNRLARNDWGAVDWAKPDSQIAEERTRAQKENT